MPARRLHSDAEQRCPQDAYTVTLSSDARKTLTQCCAEASAGKLDVVVAQVKLQQLVVYL